MLCSFVHTSLYTMGGVPSPVRDPRAVEARGGVVGRCRVSAFFLSAWSGTVAI